MKEGWPFIGAHRVHHRYQIKSKVIIDQTSEKKHYILIFKKHATSEPSVDADGFDVCFEMGRKCYEMRALYIPSL